MFQFVWTASPASCSSKEPAEMMTEAFTANQKLRQLIFPILLGTLESKSPRPTASVCEGHLLGI